MTLHTVQLNTSKIDNHTSSERDERPPLLLLSYYVSDWLNGLMPRSASFLPLHSRQITLPHVTRQQSQPSDVTLMTAIVGGGIGAGYVAVRLFRQSRALLTTGKAEAEGRKGRNEKEKFPMLDMAEVARRAVPRKKSFLYTRSGDKGTSQVYNIDL